MSDIRFYSSDDNVVEATIEKDGAVVSIPTDATVTISVQDIRGVNKIMGDITILSTDDGNDWNNGEIKGIFSDEESEALISYHSKEVQVVVRITTVAGITTSYTENIIAMKLL